MKKYSNSYQKLFRAVLASGVAGGALVAASPIFVHANDSGPALFNDLNPKAHYFEPVMNLSARGIVHGYEDSTYKPNNSVTRGQAAKILALSLGLDTVNVKNPGFVDMKETDSYYGPIAALVEAGIINGYEDKTFKPNNALKRSQMAKIITLGFGLEQEALTDTRFSDVRSNDAYAGYVQALLSNNITTGTTPTTFGPNALVTRGQIASFIFRSEVAVSLNGISSQIVNITNDTIELTNGSYRLQTEMKALFNPSNLSALKGAKITVNVQDDVVERISSLEITASGTASDHVMLDGHNASLKGNLVINGDYISINNLVIEGNLEVGKEVNNSFQSEAITVKGKTIVSDNSSAKEESAVGIRKFYNIASVQSFNVSADSKTVKNKPTIIFSNSTMGTIEVSKKDVTIESKGTTKVQSFVLSSNVHLKADKGVVIPNVVLSEGVKTVTIDAPVTNLTINSKSSMTIEGTGDIGEIKVDSNNTVKFETKGKITNIVISSPTAKLSFGADTKIGNLVLPEGIEAGTIIQDYDKVKGNIEKIGGETNPEAKPATPAPAPPATGGSGGGSTGGNTGGGNDGSVQQPEAPKSVTLAQDSLGVAGDKKITGLTSGKKYAVIVNGEFFGVKENGTLGLKNSSAEVLSGSEITRLDNTKTYKVIEATGGIVAQDFGLVSGTMYSAGAALTEGKKLSDIDTLTVEWFDYAGKSLGKGTLTDKLANDHPEHTQLSMPLDPRFDYEDDGYWNVEGITAGEPTKVTFTVKYKNWVVAKIDNTRAATTGGIVAQDFGFVAGTMYSAGAGLTEGKTVSDIDSLTVEWFGQNDKPLGKGKLTDKLAKVDPYATQVSMPLDSTFEYTKDGFWDVDGIKLGEPTKVTFTVKYKNGVVATIDNTRGESGEIIDTADKLRAAIDAAGENDTIYVAEGTYELSKQLQINKAITVKGLGKVTIKSAEVFYEGTYNADKHLVSIDRVNGLVQLENLTISNAKRTGINVFESTDVKLKNIVSKDNAGAGLGVTNSVVVADNLQTSGNSWYSINVDNGSSPSAGAPKSKFTLNGGALSEATQIVSDKGNVTVEADSYLEYKIHGTTKSIWSNKPLMNVITIDGSNTVYPSIQSAIDAAKTNDTINVPEGTYQLSKQLLINKAVTVKGIGEVTIKSAEAFDEGTYNADKHLVSIDRVNGLVQLENLTISNAKRTGINVFESTDVKLKNIVSKNNVGAGLGVTNSVLVADNLQTSGNSWYGINVDNGSSPSTGAPKTSFTLNSGTLSEATQIVSDKGNVTVEADGYLEYKIHGTTKSIWSNKPLMNFITINDASNSVYTSIQAAIDAAGTNDTVNVPAGTYELSEQLTIEKSISIIGAGESTIIKVSKDLGEDNGSKHALSIYSKGVKISNLTIDSNSKAFGVHVYGDASADLESVKIQNSKGAGLTVNGSTVVASNLNTSSNIWGAVNVDPGKNVSTESNFELVSGNLVEDIQIWSDGKNVTNIAIVIVITPEDYKRYKADGATLWSNKPLNDVIDQEKDVEEVLAKFSNINVADFDYRQAIATYSELLNLEDGTISNLSNLTKNQGRDLAVNLAIQGFQPDGGYKTLKDLKFALEIGINTEYHKQLFIVAMNNAGTNVEAIKLALLDTLPAVAEDRLELIRIVSNYGDELAENIKISDFSVYTKKMLDDLGNDDRLTELSTIIAEYISKEGNAIGGSGDKAIEAIKHAYSNAE